MSSTTPRGTAVITCQAQLVLTIAQRTLESSLQNMEEKHSLLLEKFVELESEAESKSELESQVHHLKEEIRGTQL
jgi:hypothetical protein